MLEWMKKFEIVRHVFYLFCLIHLNNEQLIPYITFICTVVFYYCHRQLTGFLVEYGT